MKKKYILLLSIFGIYLISVVLIVLVNNHYSMYLIFPNAAVIQYKNGSWNTITDTVNLFGSNKFTVYSDDQLLGNYEMQFYNKKWYLFDDENNPVSYEGEIFAYKTKRNVDIESLEQLDYNIEEIEKIQEKLKDEKISIVISNDDEIKKTKLSNEQILYTISNMFLENESESKYSLLVSFFNNKIKILDYDIKKSEDSLTNGGVYDIFKSIDNYIIIRKSFYSNPDGDCYKIYKKNKFIYQVGKSC